MDRMSACIVAAGAHCLIHSFIRLSLKPPLSRPGSLFVRSLKSLPARRDATCFNNSFAAWTVLLSHRRWFIRPVALAEKKHYTHKNGNEPKKRHGRLKIQLLFSSTPTIKLSPPHLICPPPPFVGPSDHQDADDAALGGHRIPRVAVRVSKCRLGGA